MAAHGPLQPGLAEARSATGLRPSRQQLRVFGMLVNIMFRFVNWVRDVLSVPLLPWVLLPHYIPL